MHYAWLLILLPLAGSAWIALWGAQPDRTAAEREEIVGNVASYAVLGAFAVAVLLLARLLLGHGTQLLVAGPTWIAVRGLTITFGLQIDPLSVTMALVVTGVGYLIHLFARGYMHGDPDFPRFFALLNLFIGAMLILVLAGNLVFMFMGWEGVGFCSYMLIGYYTQKPSASQAGKKAFIVNRIGDLGFLLGTFLVWRTFGHMEFAQISHQASAVLQAAPGAAAWIAFLLFVGACGKSAQFPLYVWLPDAMEGPTPVSALIHAATMVTAGVYLVVRMSPVYVEAPGVMTLVAFVGLLTAVLAALLALVQNDIKKVLAYSTISQLGFMFLAAGMGAFTAAIFHLVTHAFFKALLFLGSGSVIHGMEHAIHHAGRHDDPQDMRNMGGLAAKMPTTHWTMLVGALAIAGCPLLAGFWSKDEILHHTGQQNSLFLVVAWGVALLTAFYMFRLIAKTFYQEPKLPAEVASQVHESAPLLTLPLTVLGVLAAFGGLLNLPVEGAFGGWLHHFLEPVVGEATVRAAHGVVESNGLPYMVISSLIALAGMGLAWKWYQLSRGEGAKLAQRYPGFYRALTAKYYLDWFYDTKLVAGGNLLAERCADTIDAGFIDGGINALARGVVRLGENLRRYQPGFVRSYALWFVVGAVGVVGYLALQTWGSAAAVVAVLVGLGLAGAVGYVARPGGER